METVTNAASNVASVASRAIWGEPTSNKDTKTNETVEVESGKEPPATGEVGDVKLGEPYDKGNEEEPSTTASEPKSLTKTTSKEISSADSTADLPSASTAAQKLTSPTETLATTQIEPLKDAKDSQDPIGGVTGLTPQVKTEANTSVASDGVNKLTLKDESSKTDTKGTDDLKKDVTAANATSTSSTATASKTSTSTSDEKDKDHKLSLKEKIKAKLHHKH